MHRDEAFGAVEKPIKTQCEKMHTEIRTQMWRGMRYFFVVFCIPHCCRGAVGVYNRAFTPKDRRGHWFL